MNRLLAAASALIAILFFPLSASAHNDFELDVAAGYRFPFGAEITHQNPSGEDLGEGDLSFDGGLIFSGQFGYRIRRDGFIYISYTRGVHDVEFEQSDASSGFGFTGTRAVEYYQFGGRVEKTSGRFVPFMGFSVGIGRISPVGAGDDRIFFAPVLEPGLKFDLHKNVHLRLSGRAPLLFTKKELVCVNAGCAYADKIKPIGQLEVLGGVGVSF